jgi:aspartyl-tRNA(Asn)/glutamyl-tRNA(Gln) amidotransferase subunit A
MDMASLATWVGLEPTPALLNRLEPAAPLVTGPAQAIAALEGISDDEVPAIESRAVPVRYEVPSGQRAVTRPCELGVIEAALAIRNGEVSPVELLESCLTMIEHTDQVVGAFVRLTDDLARRQAELAAAGPPTGVLHGIPFAATDLVDTGNVPTEGGSAAFTGRTPRWDATVVARIRAAGGILVGKTATREIGFGVSTPHAHNPWDPGRMTSGATAALAARQIPMVLGTDTGGSLRLPSAFCATTAIRPTFGLVPHAGVMALAPSFDTVGPMARSARDCLLLLRVLIHEAPPEPQAPVVDLRQVRIGVATGATPDQRAVASILGEQGAELTEITLPPLEITQAVGSLLTLAEAATEYRADVRRGAPFAEDITALLEVGLTVPVADFLHAQRVRAAIRRDYAELFGRVDLLLSPTSPVTDLPHGITEHDGMSLLTMQASLTGLPAIAFPCGFTTSGMPVGAQLMGPPHSEPLLAAVADAYQQVTDWHLRLPPMPPRH